MSETNIPLSRERRGELREYKAQYGETYDQAIARLLDDAGWYEDSGEANR